MGTRYLYKEVLPCIAMVAVECSTVVSNILFKAATSKGLTFYIFIAYSSAFATIALIPITFFLIRKAGLPPFNFPLISRLCLLALTGLASKLGAYKGLELSSPTLSSAISNLIPAFTFVLAVFFRMEKVTLTRASHQAKIIGTITSIFGASVIVLYKGPKVLSSPHSTPSSSKLLQQPLQSSQSNWVFGGLILTMGYLCTSLWYIIQAQIMKIYPEEIIVNFIYYVCITILFVPICLLAESNMSSWRLRPDIALVSILFSGIFSLSFSTTVHTWGVKLKGPVYVAIFRPLSIVISAVMSAIFLGDTLYLGSVIGALILSVGLYAVLWGKANEEDMKYYNDSASSNSSSSKAPLLPSDKDEEDEM